MKNLKKVLALVLVVALMMGFATIAGASDFSDDADIDHSEAVEVMEMIGVINGYPDGSFRPDGNVTRAQMATMVAYIVAGGDDVGNLYAGANTFSDCTTHWARGYIAYANHTGIIAGVGNGRFNPDGNVTGAQAAKMMLCALGYDQNAENYVGTGWQVHVLADARTVGLLDGIENIDVSAALSRQDAAQLMFNALKAPMVQYAYGGIVISGDTNVTISGATAEPIREGDDDAEQYNYLLLREQYFPDLREVPANDLEEMNRPSHDWVYNDEEVGHYVDAPTFLYTAETSETAVNGDLRSYSFAYEVNASGRVISSVRVISNDRTIDNTIVQDAADVAALTTYGGPVEVYTHRDYNGVRWVDVVVVIRPNTGTITIRNYAETADHGAYDLYSIGTYVARDYSTVVNAKTDVSNVVLHGDVADGDTVTYYWDNQDNLHVTPTTEITGVLSAVGRNGSLTIDGETYYRSVAVEDYDDFTAAKSEQTFAVDEYGYIVDTIVGSEEASYGVVLDVVDAIAMGDDTTESGENIGTLSKAAVVATSTGEVRTIVINELDGNANPGDPALNALPESLVRYTANGSKYDLETITGYADANNVVDVDGIDTGTSVLTTTEAPRDPLAPKNASSSTIYVVVNYDDNDDPDGTVTTYTGYANAFTDSTLRTAWAVDTNSSRDGIANVVFIVDPDAADSGNDTYVYLTGDWDVISGGKVAYHAIIKGEATTVEASGHVTAIENRFYNAATGSYTAAPDGIMFSELNVSTPTVTPAATSYDSVRNNGGLVTVYNINAITGRRTVAASYTAADDVPVYYIDTDSKVPGETLTVGDLSGYADGDIYLSLNNTRDKVIAVYVLYGNDM